MCGICGLVAPELASSEVGGHVQAMVGALAHRGPDGSGQLVTDGLGLGHTRLSIIDIANGQQPMRDERGFVIVYNGEVYNYRTLREQLQLLGERFTTSSDTEVVLRAYAHWGTASFGRLAGMFAFAIFDPRCQSVLLVRDRMGIKPLHYSAGPFGLIFASEARAITATSLADTSLDLAGVPDFLSSGYFPRDRPLLASHQVVEPGSYVVTRGGVVVERLRYWSAAEVLTSTPRRRATSEDVDELRSLVRTAVEDHCVADVPIGVFLSGGLDSGIVAAHVDRVGRSDMTAITVRFDSEEGAREAAIAADVAGRYGLRHQVIDCRGDDIQSNLVKVLATFDEPFADASAIAMRLASDRAREHVKVMLSGDGGDELFGGYAVYRRYAQLRRVRWLSSTPGVLSILGGSGRLLGARHAERVDFYRSLLRSEPGDLFRSLISHMPHDVPLLGDAVLDGMKERPQEQTAISAIDLNGEIDQIMLWDLTHSLVDDMLTKVDTASMAASLEVRVPILDHRVVEFALNLSSKSKVGVRRTKKILRDAFHMDLPPSVLSSRKTGFDSDGVLDGAFRGQMRPFIRDVLLSPAAKARGVVPRHGVVQVLEQHDAGLSRGKLITSLLALELWFLKREGVAVD